jgi:hypothetical protein
MRGSKIYYESSKDYDVIDIATHFNLNFFRFNVFKYIVRAGKKDDELQDLYKAKDYIEREIAFVRELRNKEAEDIKEGAVSPYSYNYKERQ